MDYMTSRLLGNQFKNLDKAIARGDKIAIMMARQSIDELLRKTDIGSPEPSLPGCLPGWLKQVVRDQGLKIPALAEAVGAHKVVIQPTFGGNRFGIEIKGKF